MSMRSRLAKGTVLFFAGSVVMILMSYARNLMIARSLGPEQLGILTIAGTIIGWVATIFLFGLHESAGKYVAQHLKEKTSLRSGVRWTIRLGLLSGLAGVLLVALISMPVAYLLFHDPRLTSILVILSIGIPITIVLYISNSINLALGHVQHQVIINNIVLPVTWIVLVALVWSGNLGLTAMALTFPMSGFIATILAYMLVQRSVGSGEGQLPNHGKAAILSVGVSLLFSSVAYGLWLKADVFFLGMFWGSREVGLYTPAFQASFILTYLVTAVYSLFSPTVASLFAYSAFGDLKQLYIETSRWCYYGNMAIGVTLFICAFQFLLLFGKEFTTDQSVMSLRILLSSFLFFSLVGAMPQVLLSMGGKHSSLAVIEICMIPITIFLHFILTKKLGVIGAAITTSSALVLVSLLRSIIVRISYGYWGVERDICKSSLVLIGSTLCGYVVLNLSESFHLLVQLFLVFLSVVVSEIILLWLIRDRIVSDGTKFIVNWLNSRIRKS